ncbi:hypothetical protein Z042_21215 [Chania multitudinisentens RB-25]|uniref:Glycosyl transferase family 1 domain-containing protein n=1 Tax=Chania multitudinisentens RB-25 TaxID=1441930 RepID=W0LLP1_9GAMM|nr:glycosyltransferase [Chania multitudinisentens]AHG22950.1 hypothetical protein Z042_21215 [Chania multitudinisentens RB-25]
MQINLLINSLKGGGTEKVCSLLASKMVYLEYQVNLFVLDSEGCDYYINDKVNVVFLGKAGTIRSFPKLVHLIRNYDIQSILVFNHELALVLFFCKFILMKNVRIISRINNTLSYSIKLKKKSYRIFVGLMMKLFYKKMDFYIFQSEGIKKDVLSNFGVKDNYVVINNPVRIPKKDNIVRSKNSMLYIGRLVRQKNIIDILKAHKLLIERGKDIYLDIVGDGPELDKLTTYCHEENILNRVNFHGHIKDVSRFFSGATVTILSSLNEGFPNVLLESLSHGTPIVSYDCPSGPEEIILDGVNGFLVEYLNHQKLAVSIEKALQHTWDEALIFKTIEKYKEDNIISEYINVFKRNSK